VGRILQRSCELSREAPNGHASELGGIDLETVQKYITYWFCYSVDLFGSEISSNAADYFAAGIKGRYQEGKLDADHVALQGHYRMAVPRDGRLDLEEIALRNAMNEVLRDEYIKDCERVIVRWNRQLENDGFAFRVRLPDRKFFRRQGIYAGLHFDFDGNALSADEWETRMGEWLPSEADRAYVQSLMGPAITEPGKFANWIAPPKKGINGQPVEFEYVRFC
jgi:benzoyl-CoA 2,3-dioxygenase component B